ncbi:MAG: DUF948 domain-containing protein [Actinomycetota bacterium]
MSVGEIAGLIAAIAFVVLVALLAVPILKLGKLIDDTRGTVQGVTGEAVPLIREVTSTVSTTNGELQRVSAITGNVQQISTNASALTSLFAATVGSPLIKVAAFTYGVRQALGRQEAKNSKKASRSKKPESQTRALSGTTIGSSRRRGR